MISIKNENLTLKDNRIVIFEGPDVCGKSTQADLFCKRESRHGSNVVRLKFPFLPENKKLKSINDDMQKYVYDTELLTKMKNNDGTVDFTKCIKRINKIITTNSSANADNKLKIISFMKYIFNRDIDNVLKELNKFKINDNDETFIKIYSNNVTLKLIHLDDKLSEIMSNENPIIIVLDRYFLSGIIYNFFLPELYYKDFFKEEKQNICDISNNYIRNNDIIYHSLNSANYDNYTVEQFISMYTNFKNLIGIKNYNIKKMLDMFDDCKKKEIENTKKIIYNINKEIYNIDNDSELCPSILTLIFKPSDLMYEDYLKSVKNNVNLNRKNEKYDTNQKIHNIVSLLYNAYAENKEKSSRIIEIIINDIILSLDSINLLGLYSLNNKTPYFNRVIIRSEFPQNSSQCSENNKMTVWSKSCIGITVSISYRNYFNELNNIFIEYNNFNDKYKKTKCIYDNEPCKTNNPIIERKIIDNSNNKSVDVDELEE